MLAGYPSFFADHITLASNATPTNKLEKPTKSFFSYRTKISALARPWPTSIVIAIRQSGCFSFVIPSIMQPIFYQLQDALDSCKSHSDRVLVYQDTETGKKLQKIFVAIKKFHLFFRRVPLHRGVGQKSTEIFYSLLQPNSQAFF